VPLPLVRLPLVLLPPPSPPTAPRPSDGASVFPTQSMYLKFSSTSPLRGLYLRFRQYGVCVCVVRVFRKGWIGIGMGMGVGME
jgi:hypothetical protein